MSEICQTACPKFQELDLVMYIERQNGGICNPSTICALVKLNEDCANCPGPSWEEAEEVLLFAGLRRLLDLPDTKTVMKPICHLPRLAEVGPKTAAA